MPQWSELHRELRQPDVTLALLWQEYKAAHPEGLQYSWFCDQYRAWASKLDVVMRQEHRAGEKLFVDYAGRTVAVVDRHTGELRQAQVFVAVLGASNYTFTEDRYGIRSTVITSQLPVENWHDIIGNPVQFSAVSSRVWRRLRAWGAMTRCRCCSARLSVRNAPHAS